MSTSDSSPSSSLSSSSPSPSSSTTSPLCLLPTLISPTPSPPSTPALLHLHSIHYYPPVFQYPYVEKGGTAASSSALGCDEHVVIKTLVFQRKGKEIPFIVLQHGDYSVDNKKLAKVIQREDEDESANESPLNGKGKESKKISVSLVTPEVSLLFTGYKVGGTSPFGLKTSSMRIYIEKSILSLPSFVCNGGERGTLIQVESNKVREILNPIVVEVGSKMESKKTEEKHEKEKDNKDNNGDGDQKDNNNNNNNNDNDDDKKKGEKDENNNKNNNNHKEKGKKGESNKSKNANSSSASKLSDRYITSSSSSLSSPSHLPPSSFDILLLSSLSTPISDTLPALSTLLSPTPLTVHYSPSTGRYLTASSSLPPSTTLISSHPFCLSLHDSFRKRGCHHVNCEKDGKWNYEGKMDIGCKGCGYTMYCSEECREVAKGYHQMEFRYEENYDNGSCSHDDVNGHIGVPTLSECSLYKKLSSSKLDKENLIILRLIIQSICNFHWENKNKIHKKMENPKIGEEGGKEKDVSSQFKWDLLHPFPAQFTDFLTLFPLPEYISSIVIPSSTSSSSPSSSPSPSPSPSSRVSSLREMLKECKKLFPSMAPETFYIIAAKIQANSFGVWSPPKPKAKENKENHNTLGDDDDAHSSSTLVVGRAVYPFCSYFNHSCRPNSHVVSFGNSLHVVTLKDVAKGEELSISYVEKYDRKEERKRNLVENFGFSCQCIRCNEGDNEEEMKGIKWKKSGGAEGGKGKDKDKEKDKGKENEKESDVNSIEYKIANVKIYS